VQKNEAIAHPCDGPKMGKTNIFTPQRPHHQAQTIKTSKRNRSKMERKKIVVSEKRCTASIPNFKALLLLHQIFIWLVIGFIYWFVVNLKNW
jgi:hypothetical protein